MTLIYVGVPRVRTRALSYYCRTFFLTVFECFRLERAQYSLVHLKGNSARARKGDKALDSYLNLSLAQLCLEPFHFWALAQSKKVHSSSMVSGSCLVLLALRTRDEYLSAFYMAVLLFPASHFLASCWNTVFLQMYCCIKCIILHCIKCGNNHQLTTFSQYFRVEWGADSRSNIKTHVQTCMSGCESQSLHSSQALQFSRKSAIILSSLLPVWYYRWFYSGCCKSSPFPWIVWAMSEPGDS